MADQDPDPAQPAVSPPVPIPDLAVTDLIGELLTALRARYASSDVRYVYVVCFPDNNARVLHVDTLEALWGLLPEICHRHHDQAPTVIFRRNL